MATEVIQGKQLPETLPRLAVPPSVQERHRNHLSFIDGMRALAALYVVVHHALYEVWPQDNSPNYFIGLFGYGHFAVSVFIVLSGFSLMIPVIRGDDRLAGGAVQFFIARARRILPPYYFALGLSLLLVFFVIGQPTGSHWDASIPVTSTDILYHILLVQDFFDPSKINHVFWSISVEWHIYIFFPLLVFLRRIGGMLLLGSIIVTCFIVFITLGHTSFGAEYWIDSGFERISLTYFALFGIGMFGAVIAFSSKQPWQYIHQNTPWLAISGILALLIFRVNAGTQVQGYVPNYSVFTDVAFIDFLLALFTVSLLILGARQETNLVKTILGWKPLAFIGTFAYSIYLIHAPLIHMVWLYVVHPLHKKDSLTFVLLILIGLPLIVGFSYLFYLVCERPFVSTKRKGGSTSSDNNKPQLVLVSSNGSTHTTIP